MVNICSVYGKTLLFALPFFMLQNCFQSFLVVAEKPAMGLGVSLAAGLTNMVLDFLFIYVFGLGVFGAALATGISQFIGAMIPIFYFARKNKSPLKLVKYAGYDGVVAYGIIMYVGFILSALTSATRSELLRLSDTTTAQEIPMS